MVRVGMRRFCQVALVLLLGLWTAVAYADTRTSFFAQELRSNEDYRVRTQAALALGASGDDAAIKPLCDGLKDTNASVRTAAAAALGKLGKSGGTSCLKDASKKEREASVKSQIDKSIAQLSGGG